MQMNLVTPEERKMLNDAGVTTIKQLKASPLRQKLSTSSLANVDKIDGLIGDTNADYGIAEITPEKPALETTKAEAPALKARGYEADKSGEDGNGYGMFRPALQQVLLPDSLQGALLKRAKYDRVETPLVSPNQQITELRRQEQSAMQGLQNLPDSQKAAAIAQIQANTQNGINQAVAQTQGSNQQARFNTDVTNAQVQMKEEDMRNNNLQEYENKITTADAKTQANLRNYYNTIEKIRVNADAFDVNQRLIGSMYENTGFNGNELYTKNMEKAKAYDEMANLSEAEKSEKRKKDEATYQKTLKLSVTPVKKRFGGRK